MRPLWLVPQCRRRSQVTAARYDTLPALWRGGNSEGSREVRHIYTSTCKDGRIFSTMVCVADSLSAAREKAEEWFGSTQVTTRELTKEELKAWRPILERQKGRKATDGYLHVEDTE